MKYSPKPSCNSVKMPLTVISRVEMGVKNWPWSKEINNTDWIWNFQTVTIIIKNNNNSNNKKNKKVLHLCEIWKDILYSTRQKEHQSPLHFRETSIQHGNYFLSVKFNISNLIRYFLTSSYYFPQLAFRIINLPKLRNDYLPEIERRCWVQAEESVSLTFAL